jgi:large subunit ribosomal protein L25
MTTTVVTAEPGRDLGSASARRLRTEGRIPGVVYGLDKDPVPVSVDYAELRHALSGEAGLNTVFTIQVDGDQDLVLIRHMQRDPLKRTVAHADFLRVDPTSPLKLKVPVRLVGTPRQVTTAGGIVEQKLFDLTVLVRPDAIPASIDVDVSVMTMERRLTVADIVLPDGATHRTEPTTIVAAPVATRASRGAAAATTAAAGKGGKGGKGGGKGGKK